MADNHDSSTVTGAAARSRIQPSYVYVASSWRNPLHVGVCAALRSAGIAHYDYRHPSAAFSWRDVDPDWEHAHGEDFVAMLDHPRAQEGFRSDFAALERADTCVLVLPCGRSAHLELGYAIASGKESAILLDRESEPELMYRMADYLAPTLMDLLAWLGIED